MTILIKNGHVVDPASKTDCECDILLEGSTVSKVAKGIKEKAAHTIDAQGKIVMPGIFDMHVHLREPGREDKETVSSGTSAGLRGGVTSLLAMPNTQPAIDSAKNVQLLREIIAKTAQSNVFIAGAITVGRRGKELVDIAALKKAGVVALTDDGCSVDSDKIFAEALKKARKHTMLVICHCEDKKLSREGVLNLGLTSTILGLKGISRESEYKRVARDLMMAERHGAPVHIAHVSCRESVDIIAAAKKKGAPVTAETAPHYFSLDETAVMDYNTNMKINPPLRNKADVGAIKQGLRDGIIDVIASDHAPHTENEKDIEFDRAEFGTIGLETTLAVAISELVLPGVLDWVSLVRKISFNPARILGVKRGALCEGSIADIVIVDPQKEWIVTKEAIGSQSKNSAFIGRKLKGSVDYTIVNGTIVFQCRKVQ